MHLLVMHPAATRMMHPSAKRVHLRKLPTATQAVLHSLPHLLVLPSLKMLLLIRNRHRSHRRHLLARRNLLPAFIRELVSMGNHGKNP